MTATIRTRSASAVRPGTYAAARLLTEAQALLTGEGSPAAEWLDKSAIPRSRDLKGPIDVD